MKAALTPDCLTLTLSIHELASRGPTEVDPVCCDQSTPQSSYNATATRHRRAHTTFQRQLSKGTWFVLSTVLNICVLLDRHIIITTHSELREVLFLVNSQSIQSVVFLFVYEISRELLNGFAPNSHRPCLVPRSNEFEG